MKLKLLKILSRDRISGAAFITQKLLNDSFGRKAKGLMVQTFKRMLPAIKLGTTKFRLSIIVKLVYKFSSLYKNQGMKGLVIYLKSVTVVLQQSLAEFHLRDMTGLNARVARTGRGLPRIIPSQDRALIRKGDTNLMRFYLTIFNLYRILSFPGTLKLKSITDPFKGNPALKDVYNDLFEMVPLYRDVIFKRAGNKLGETGITMSPILKASPGSSKWTSSSHPLTLLMTAQRHKVLGSDRLIAYFAKYFDKGRGMPSYPGFFRIFDSGANLALNLKLPSTDFCLGRLGMKEEAAGKIRVFAMVDAWTNWCLEPLHKEIFRILKHLPMDGTFDQLAPVRNYRAWPSAYSLDLTAATDRLPISLQIRILETFYGKEFAVNWAALLVDRDYYLEDTRKEMRVQGVPNHGWVLRYSVGQPMGALSSWAMLALTHHFIVQAAAWQSGLVPRGTLYTNYAILGDDLVIGDMKVKDKYLRIIDAVGVECGLHKSVLSQNGVGIEFAKKTFYKGVDVSPVPLLEFITATYTLPSAIAFAHKYSLTLAQLIKSMGFGYKVLGRLDQHIGSFSRKVRLLYMAFNSPLITSESDVTEWLAKGNQHVPTTLVEPLKLFQNEVTTMVTALISKSFRFRTADWITDFTKNFRSMVWERFGLVYLTNILAKEVKETGIVVSDGVARRFWANTWRKGDREVPVAVFNRVKSDLEDLDLWLARVLSNLVGPQVALSRDNINRIQGDMTMLGPQNRIAQSYVYSIQALKEINNVNVITDFKRVDDELRPRMDVVQIRLWRLWTSCMNEALRKASANEKHNT